MKRLYVYCEGRTEQQFCHDAIAPYLFPEGDGSLHGIDLGGLGPRKRQYSYLLNFIRDHIPTVIREGVFFTTFIDLYAIPSGFPGYLPKVPNPSDPTPYVESLEAGLALDVNQPRCFIPYIQLHEFETMLFVDLDQLKLEFEDCEKAIEYLKHQTSQFSAIEQINSGQHSAPSKRIIQAIPEYKPRKASVGPSIAAAIGIDKIRQACPHFDQWLTKLEAVLSIREAG
jgi:hypothetical protein